MSIKHRMKPGFRSIEGGLFSSVSKADVGDSFARLQEQGVTLLGWADPFFPDPAIPKHVLSAMIDALQTGFPAHYTMPIGNSRLKELIAKKIKAQCGIPVNPQRNLLITPGSDSGLFYSMFPFIGEGDEIMVPNPSYPNNAMNVKTFGGVMVDVPLHEKEGYQLSVDEFKKRLTPRTKMVVLTNPNNPTSTVFRRDRLEELAQFIVENDLICVVDQAFEDMVYDHAEMVTVAALPEMWERTITVYSVSKGMALSGFRVGYLMACDEIMDVLHGAAVSVLGATNTAAQLGAIAAFEQPQFVREYSRIFDKRRRVIYDIINSTPGVSMFMPESAFLCWIDVSRLGDSSEICSYLIEEAHVAVNDGKAYGSLGEGHIRVVFGCLQSDEALYDAFTRMSAAFTKLAREKRLIEP